MSKGKLEKLADAADFVRRELQAGRLEPRHIAVMAASFQAEHGLANDGKPGAATREKILSIIQSWQIKKSFPLAALKDGRPPVITSGFHTRNPSRPTHMGVDFFYRYDPEIDGPVKLGDGGATRGADGKPKWFIPDGTFALAAADGIVAKASKIATGYRVAINHNDGMQTIYCHLRSGVHFENFVKVGQSVARGARIGVVGDNPVDVDAAHLHLEVSPSSFYAPIDPELWLAGAFVIPAL